MSVQSIRANIPIAWRFLTNRRFYLRLQRFIPTLEVHRHCSGASTFIHLKEFGKELCMIFTELSLHITI